MLRSLQFIGRQWKLLLAAVLASVATLVVVIPHEAAAATHPPIEVYLDLEQMEFEVAPIIKNGTTLVPFRALFEAMGLEVEWHGEERKVTGTKDGLEISLIIDEKQATVNGEVVPLLEAAQLVDDRTLVPLRFVSEAAGAFVAWDPMYYQISIVTEPFMEEHNLTIAMLEEAVEQQLAEREEAEEQEQSEPEEEKPDPVVHKPAVEVNLAELDGMFYGSRGDLGGYECGGICWELYTFLPNNQVVIGLPANGGPETIDCAEDECLSYTISNNLLKLSNGEELPISINDNGFLVINEVILDAVLEVADGTALDDEYRNLSYYGLIGITPAASSRTMYLTFHSDGTFEAADLAIGSLGAMSDPSTHVATVGEDGKGMYVIEGNTLTLTYDDGTEEQFLFFIHNDNPEGEINDIQIGSRYFHND